MFSTRENIHASLALKSSSVAWIMQKLVWVKTSTSRDSSSSVSPCRTSAFSPTAVMGSSPAHPAAAEKCGLMISHFLISEDCLLQHLLLSVKLVTLTVPLSIHSKPFLYMTQSHYKMRHFWSYLCVLYYMNMFIKKQQQFLVHQEILNYLLTLVIFQTCMTFFEKCFFPLKLFNFKQFREVLLSLHTRK